MQVSNDKEPITPLLSRIRELHASFGTSFILAVGALGDYFEVSLTNERDYLTVLGLLLC